MTGELLLTATGLAKTYVMRHKTVQVLCGAEMQVTRGETIAIVGASGAGKSTLLHILGGLDRPDRGTVCLGGDDLYGLSEARRSRVRAERIGFVFQAYHLLPEMSVLENVMLPAMVRSRPFSPITGMQERARRLLKSVGIEERAGHMPPELSGGEQQRVALSRALMNEPEIVLADEPTGNLDDVTGTQVLESLFAMTRERGHSLVMVTHNPRIAARCDRVLHLKGGQLV
jgi:predicted ABC-type transport system involved in lysophospholipase L1 biosynthesis ATPase subunit